MNNFKERYKQLATSKLLEILAEADKYQPEAIEMVKQELQKRELSGEGLDEARKDFELFQLKKIEKEEKRETIKGKINDYKSDILDLFTPTLHNIKTTERFIRVVALVLVLRVIYLSYYNLAFVVSIILDEAIISPYIFQFFLLLTLYLIAALLFWKRKKRGWIILAMLLTNTVLELTVTLYWNFFGVYRDFLPFWDYVMMCLINTMTLIFWAGMFWAMSRENIRKIYKIESSNELLQGIGFGIIYFTVNSL